MAKKSKSKATEAPATVQVPIDALVIDRLGPTKGRQITKVKLQPSIFTLDDGTKLHVTARIGDVRRAIDQYRHDGAPLYFLTVGHAIETKAPRALYRKKPKTRKTKGKK